MTEQHDACWKRTAHDERLALPVEQGVLLWCMRLRVVGMKRGIDVQAGIDEMLEALGALGASSHFERFMLALNEGCIRMIEVRCVCQKRLHADERALLDVFALAQTMRGFEALLVLRGFVTHAGAAAALHAAEGVGTALAQAGRFLPEPTQEIGDFAITQTGFRASSGLQTFH